MQSEFSSTHPEPHEYCSYFKKYGDPGKEYLLCHYTRFCKTKSLLDRSFGRPGTKRLLDVGAHWLHNCLLYALDGFEVTAAELKQPWYLKNPMVRGVSRAHGIRLLGYKDLSCPEELEALSENSFDCILFTEILEHIAFNPVRMWTALYRLLAPGGRIVITTPNYFGVSNLRGGLRNLISMKSTGPSINEILETHTFGHHWKLYSVADIKGYFELLSPDFRLETVRYFDYAPSRTRLGKLLIESLKPLLPGIRETLYAEVILREKKMGIVARPHW